MTTWSIDSPQRLALDGEVTSLEVRLAQGKFRVVGADGPARVEVDKVGRRGVRMRHVNGVLEIFHEYPKWRWNSPFWWALIGRRALDADISVAVAPDVAGRITVVSGSVVISGLRHGAVVEVIKGSITLMGVSGTIRAKTVSGSVQALGIGGDVRVEAMSGEISLADISAQRVNARTVSGSVTADLDNPAARDVHLHTTSGEITVRVPEDADLDVHLSTVSGRVASAFTQVRPNNSPGNHGASGVLGSGAGSLNAFAVSGSVSLLSRPAASGDSSEVAG